MARNVTRLEIGPRTRARGAQPDPYQIFKNADNFRHAIETLVAQPGDIRFGQPLIVLSAFASELFLKCIICLEAAKVPRRHDLHALFSRISNGTRIRAVFDVEFAKRFPALDEIERTRGIKIPRDLDSLLILGANTFEDVRYAHEAMPGGSFYLADLPGVLSKVILEMKPEWGS